jgi:hypothetical protein
LGKSKAFAFTASPIKKGIRAMVMNMESNNVDKRIIDVQLLPENLQIHQTGIQL